MKNRPNKPLFSLVMAGSLAATLGWSNDSYACASDPYISSVCLMALAGPQRYGFDNMFLPANGQTLAMNQYAAMYSLLGFTYGGDGRTNFNLPDLRGRVVVGAGAGPGLPAYNIGASGGAPTITLTTANMPPHIHTLTTGTGGVTVATGTGSLTATTTLTGLNATTSLSGVTATANGSGLALNASNTGGGTGVPTGAALASTGLTKIYVSATPNVAMATGSISGSAPVTFSGNPTTTITGNPTTTLSGAPSVAVSGSTGITGNGVSIYNMQPYLAMKYFIAVNGIYPSPN